MQRCGRALSLVVPEAAETEPPTALALGLTQAGLADAPRMFAEASGAAAVGVRPPPGSPLEARFFVEHIRLLVEELTSSGHLPFDGDGLWPRPESWEDAAAMAGALLAQASVAFRAHRRPESAVSVWGGSTTGQEGLLEGRRDRPPPDAFEEVPVASKQEMQLAVAAELLHTVTAPSALATEYKRASVFKSFTVSSDLERDRAMAGEAEYFVSKYGQAASAFLVSNGRASAKTRGVGIPPALSGLRAHLLRRATSWVEEQYGVERAAADRDAAAKLALSMLCGAVPGDTDGKVAAEVIVRLLGGTKPHALAEVDEEGGSVTAGTLGTLQGEAAQSSIRTAFRLWMVGVAQAFGVVMMAQVQVRAKAQAAPAPLSRDLLGPSCDFGVDELLRQVPPLLPLPELLSICHFLTTRMAAGALRHRTRAGADFVDIQAIVSFMDEEVVHSRLRDFRQVTRAAELAAKFLGRPNPSEGLHASSSHLSRTPGAPAGKGKVPVDSRVPGGAEPSPPPPPGTPKMPASSTDAAGGASEGLFQHRLPAIKAFQAEIRARLGLEQGRPHGTAEPCAWRALTGKCRASGTCLNCQSTVPAPADLVQAIIQRSKRGLFAGSATEGA